MNRQQRFYQNQIEKGLKRVNVWVHNSREKELKEVAAKLAAPAFLSGETEPLDAGIDYQIIRGNLTEIEPLIRDHLRNGWKLSGPIQYMQGDIFVQALVI